MALRSKLGLSLGAAVVVLAALPALAQLQPGVQGTTDPAPTGTGNPASTATGQQGGYVGASQTGVTALGEQERKRQLAIEAEASAPDDVAQAKIAKYLGAMSSTKTDVEKKHLAAAGQGDPKKTQCLSDVLSQIDAAITSAGEAAKRWGAATGDGKRNAYTMVVTHAGRAENLQKEANQCIGKEGNPMGQDQVTTVVDKKLPPDQGEGTDGFNNGSAVVNPPQIVTPTT